jgi:PAS domain S-box-containing protein
MVPRSVASRVYIICVLFALFCSGIIVWPLVQLLSERQVRVCTQHITAHTDLTAQRIDAYLAGLLARPVDVLSAYDIWRMPVREVRALLEGALRLDRACEELALVTGTGTLVRVTRPDLQPAARVLHAETKVQHALHEGARQIGRITVCSNTPGCFLEVVWPIQKARPAQAGALWARFNLRYVRNMLSTSALGAHGYMCISDDHTIMLANATYPAATTHSRSAHRKAPQTLWELPLRRGVFDEVIVAVTRPLPSISWSVTLALPTEDVLRPQYAMLAGFGLIVIAIVVAGAALSLVIARWLTMPVRTLSAAAHAIGAGHFDTVVPALGRNEFGVIADAFNAMALGIRDRTATIRRTQAYLTAAIHSSPVGIVIADAPAVRPTIINAAAAALYGVTPEQVLALRTLTAGDTPWSWPHLSAAPLERTITEGVTLHDEEAILQRADGSRRTVNVNAAPIRDQHGVTVAGVLMLMDVTERAAAQQDLVQRDRLLQSIARGLGVLLQTADIKAAVPRFLEVIGQACAADRVYVFENHRDAASGAQMMSQRYEWCRPDVTPQIDNPLMQNLPYAPALARLETTLQEGQAFAGHVRDFPSGERAVFEPQDIKSILVVPIIQAGSFWGFIGFDAVRGEQIWPASDIAILRIAADCLGATIHRSQADDELITTKEQLTTVLRSMPLPVFAKDAAGRYIVCNAAFMEFFGVGEADVLGKTVAECWPHEDAAVFHQKDLEVMADDSLQVYEHQVRNARGDMRHVIFTKACFHDARGAVTGIVGTIMDITERARAELERLGLERQMQHAQKLESLGILAGGIAHDFNNMLMAMLGNLDLAQMTLSPASPAWPTLEEARNAARRAADLTRQLLAYSGKGHFEVTALDLRALAEEMVRLIDVSITKRAAIRYDFAEHVPRIRADATQVRQVIMNLVTNASEALGGTAGTIALSVRMLHCTAAMLRTALPPGAHDAGAYVELAVSDTGCGMDAATVQRVFDPFFTTKLIGRGLGMAAVLGIVRGHRGALHIASTPGRGTTVRVLFPVADATAVAQAVPLPLATSDWTAHGLVLVADDETNVRSVTARMVQTLGFDVLTATDGDQALALYRERQAAIVALILDYTMPHRDGYEALAAVRAINPTAIVIISSGYTEEDIARRFQDVAPNAYIQKPFTIAHLRAALRTALQPPTIRAQNNDER